MRMDKIYAVKRGRTLGIFTNWEECKKSVNRFYGADFRGFYTRDAAESYLSGRPNQKILAVVSGNDTDGKCSCGCIIITPNELLVKITSSVDSIECHSGVFLGIEEVYNWCKKHRYTNLEICCHPNAKKDIEAYQKIHKKSEIVFTEPPYEGYSDYIMSFLEESENMAKGFYQENCNDSKDALLEECVL